METEKKSVTLIVAWVILLIMGLLMILGGVASLINAYRGGGAIAGVSIQTLAQVNPDLPRTLRAQRATAASYALSCGLLVAWISITAFRQRQKWAWYALLCSVGLGAIASMLRVPLLDHKPGSGIAEATLIALLIALAISYRDFK